MSFRSRDSRAPAARRRTARDRQYQQDGTSQRDALTGNALRCDRSRSKQRVALRAYWRLRRRSSRRRYGFETVIKDCIQPLQVLRAKQLTHARSCRLPAPQTLGALHSPGTRDADAARPPVGSGRQLQPTGCNQRLERSRERRRLQRHGLRQVAGARGTVLQNLGQEPELGRPQARLPEFSVVVAAHQTNQLTQLRVGAGEAISHETFVQ